MLRSLLGRIKPSTIGQYNQVFAVTKRFGDRDRAKRLSRQEFESKLEVMIATMKRNTSPDLEGFYCLFDSAKLGTVPRGV
jgi:hypothetical protein